MGLCPLTAYNIYDLPGLVNIGEWQKKQHTQIEHLSLRTSAHAGVAPSGDSLRSQSPDSSENLRTTHVIANQRARWCGNPPVIPEANVGAQRLPLRFAGSILTLGGDCHTSDIGHWFAMTCFYHSAQ